MVTAAIHQNVTRNEDLDIKTFELLSNRTGKDYAEHSLILLGRE
jgi:hypothetical protein